ncbi:hypothetical protein WISP_22706 [Willisornis vidua]|uniref:PH domain-containing protein n=1 Tax=Willisornis vidua TaxID=1566151 RepID=A0ABQ9DTC7_9PASS|nr:hypothetical protein WISP_22706 [Willisornis vidua]
MALVKSGWLWRQSSILRRWKRNWFVLYLDGSLVYYHDETQRDMDGRIHVKYSCRDVRIGRECRANWQVLPSPFPAHTQLWDRQERIGIVNIPSLEVSKARLDGAWSNLVEWVVWQGLELDEL